MKFIPRKVLEIIFCNPIIAIIVSTGKRDFSSVRDIIFMLKNIHSTVTFVPGMTKVYFTIPDVLCWSIFYIFHDDVILK